MVAWLAVGEVASERWMDGVGRVDHMKRMDADTRAGTLHTQAGAQAGEDARGYSAHASMHEQAEKCTAAGAAAHRTHELTYACGARD